MQAMVCNKLSDPVQYYGLAGTISRLMNRNCSAQASSDRLVRISVYWS